MKNIKLLLIGLLLVCFGSAVSAETYLLVAGSGTKKVSIVAKSTKKLVWSHDLEAGQECNSVSMTKNGCIVYSYRGGAKLVTLDHKVIWDYKAPEKSELQLATILPDGGFLLGICGHPARIIELDKTGKLRKELILDIPVESPHGQFRTISKTQNGNYIVPILSTNEIVELDSKGKEVNRLKTEVGFFATCELKDGNLLASGGDSHQYMTLNRKTGAVINRVTQKQIAGVSFLYVAQIREQANGNRFICNWHGHNSDASINEPQLIEINKKNQLVWSLNDKATFDKISTVFVIAPNKEFNAFVQRNKGMSTKG